MKNLIYLFFIILVFSIAYRCDDETAKQTEQQMKDSTDESKIKDEADSNLKLKENIAKSKEPSKTDDEVVKREEEAISIDGLNVSQIKELREKAEKYTFQAEVDRMMKLIINSLYKNKEIFLRELISNASDALDKIRFISLTNQDRNFDNEDLYIKIKADKAAKTIHILDTGVGMTKTELIKNLGTIAKSGTSDFIQKLSEAKNTGELNELIGQFGVGFYSSFLVADKVTVISKSDADYQYIWESDASTFSIVRDPRGNTLERGTEVILHLKDEVLEFLEIDVLRNLIHKYSQFINFPIYLWKSSVKNVDEDHESAVSKRDEDANVENENERKSTERTVWDWELVNKNKPIWTRKSGETPDEEYNEFYKSFSKDSENPLAKTHFTAEGEVQFKAILYIPKKSNVEFNSVDKKNDNIKLYVKRVFITDDFDDIMPKYLSFMKGIIDSDDLPLNVSRETLQQHKILKVIKKKLVRKTLDMFKKLPEDIFKEFWKEYATNIKLGVIEDVSNRNRLAKLIRFWSSHSQESQTSLADYVSRMKPTQDKIFFIAGVSLSDVQLSPMVEILLKKQYEVLYLIEPIDEYTFQSLPEFEGKKFQNVAKEGFKLDDSDKKIEIKEKLEKEYEPLINWLKSTELKDYIEKVEISERLTTSPCVLIASTYGWSGNMERIMKAQAYQKSEEVMQTYQVNQKKILEINTQHSLIRHLKYSFSNGQDMNETRKLAKFLYDTALLRSGYIMDNVASFSKQVHEIIKTSMKIPLDDSIIDDEEIIEDTPRQTGTEKLNNENIAPKFDEENKSDKVKPLSLATFRKLLQIEDDDDLESEEEEEEDVDEKNENTEEAAEETTIDPSEEDENEIVDEDEENSELEEESQEEEENSDDDEIDESDEDNSEEEEAEMDDEETKIEPEVEVKKVYKSRKLHSITEHHVYKPTENDHDCDGIPDDEDDDIDNDGLLDHTQDSDWDGDLNHIDEDDDNDGIPDKEDPDSNGDGIPDCREDSSDNKLKLRFKSRQKRLDSDMDGVPDDSDIDDDQDGIPDILEDSDGNDIPDFLDKNRDVNNKADFEAILADAARQDHDCDGIPDQYDPDDDSDGFFDKKQDSDRDGILNEYDDDDDNDGIPDSEDPDSNGDGIPDCIMKDSDGDGIPDHIDTDDDNDGIPDLKDPNHPLFNFFMDSDNDGIPDSMDNDDDNDGIPDHRDYDADGDGESDLFPDKDKDGVPDNIDNDMNNDGIPDHMQDRDCDGIPDLIDPDDDNDGYFDNKQDSDNDGILNEWDDDDDNDGIPDINDPDSNGDGIIDCRPRDSDGDGIPDHLDPDDDNDGIPDYLDPDSMAFLLYKRTQQMDALPVETIIHTIQHQLMPINIMLYPNGLVLPDKDEFVPMEASQARHEANTDNVDLGDPGDKDCDGVPDDIDLDIDNDGKIDRTQDSDMDGELNHIDEDDDNDGIPDIEDPDANGDGIPDCRRDDFINYKLIKSRTGKIKRVLRIRKKTEEEENIDHQKKSINIKLIHQQALEIGKSDKPIKKIIKKVNAKELKKAEELKRKTTTPLPTTTKSPKITKIVKITKTVKPKEVTKLKVETKKKATTKPKTTTEKKTVTPTKTTKAPITTIKPPTKVKKAAKPKKTKKTSKKNVPKKKNVKKEKEKKTKSHKKARKILDHDCDGIPDGKDKDSDNDGVDDDLQDSDHDGIVNSLDPDDDNDGIVDALDDDANGDGIPDCKAKSKNLRKVISKKSPAKPKVKKISRKLLSVEEDDDEETESGENNDSEEESESDEEEEEEESNNYKSEDEVDTAKTSQMHNKVEKNIPTQQTIISKNKAKVVDSKYSQNKIIKNHDTEKTNKGIKDSKESLVAENLKKDSDGDGIPDYLEKDSDGDGIPDYKEDEDGDGIPDYLQNDSDGDGIPDYKEDEDGDGIPDYLEKDSDGDGIPDYMEDENGDGIPDYLEKDSDGDGIPDYKEDEDGDGIPDYLENDSDGDGIPDYMEDENGDGIPDYLEKDSDGDGIPDYKEDADGDGIPDYLDKDTESTNIKKESSKNNVLDNLKQDSDGDGIPDYLEKDSDGDGIPDYKEDEDGDGIPDYLQKDSDGDGIPDYKEDEDGDGIPDYLEKDSDGDGIPDYQEDENGDGIPDYLEKDSDGDGIPDFKEDSDGDGIPDYLDKDTDGDGIPNYKEDADGDGIPDYLDKDSDGDGIPDYKEDEDGDGIPDYLDKDYKGKSLVKPVLHETLSKKHQMPSENPSTKDSDEDGIPDYLEKDSDGDGIPDYKEDEDGDGIPDYLENDSDGDGIPDYLEDENGDGIPDYLEKDSDGDGIPDYQEDEDGDGIPDYHKIKQIHSNFTKKITPSASIGKVTKLKKDKVQVDKSEDSDGDGIPDNIDKSNHRKSACKSKESCGKIIDLKKESIQNEINENKLSMPRIIIRQVLQSLENFFGTDE